MTGDLSFMQALDTAKHGDPVARRAWKYNQRIHFIKPARFVDIDRFGEICGEAKLTARDVLANDWYVPEPELEEEEEE